MWKKKTQWKCVSMSQTHTLSGLLTEQSRRRLQRRSGFPNFYKIRALVIFCLASQLACLGLADSTCVSISVCFLSHELWVSEELQPFLKSLRDHESPAGESEGSIGGCMGSVGKGAFL